MTYLVKDFMMKDISTIEGEACFRKDMFITKPLFSEGVLAAIVEVLQLRHLTQGLRTKRLKNLKAK